MNRYHNKYFSETNFPFPKVQFGISSSPVINLNHVKIQILFVSVIKFSLRSYVHLRYIYSLPSE
jgi:hypothetical protein